MKTKKNVHKDGTLPHVDITDSATGKLSVCSMDYAMIELLDRLEIFVNASIKEGAKSFTFNWSSQSNYAMPSVGWVAIDATAYDDDQETVKTEWPDKIRQALEEFSWADKMVKSIASDYQKAVLTGNLPKVP